MRADDGDLARLTNRSWSLLFASNTPPWLYRCGGGPSWIERDNDGRPVPRPMTEDRLRHVLAQLVNWRKRAPNGDLVPAYPPPVLLKNVLATPDPALPVLAGIVTAPVFGNDGTLITEPGYHPATRLLYEPTQKLHAAAGPGATRRPQQIAAARSLLLDDLLGDFPFVGEAERAHALALLLLPFVRPMISGPDAAAHGREAGARHRRHADGRCDLDRHHRHQRERHGRGPGRGRMAQAPHRQAARDPLDPPDRQPAPAAGCVLGGCGADRALLGGPGARQVGDGPLPDPLRLDRHRQQSAVLERDRATHGPHPAGSARGSAVAARGLPPSEPAGLGVAEPRPPGGRMPHPRPRLDRRRQAAAPEDHRQLRGLGARSWAASSRSPACPGSSAT